MAVARGDKEIVQFERTSTSSFEPDFSAVTDDRPFFYFFTRSLPPMLSTVLAASTVILVVMCGWGLVGGAGGLGRKPASVRATNDAGEIVGAGETLLWRLGVMGLGAGFMLVEIPLIQRFVLWFGHPTLALGLLLGSLLLATGMGSFLSGIWIRGRLRMTWPFAVGIGIFLLAGFGALQRAVFAGATGEFGDALARALVMTVPMGLVLGVPFPMLLTAARARGESISIAMMWGVNGVASVLGSAGAISIAMMWGYSRAFAAGGVVYLLTGIVIWALANAKKGSGAILAD
jgi:hypothetical protein